MFSEEIKKLENEILALKQQGKVYPSIRTYTYTVNNFGNGDILKVTYANGDQPIISDTYSSGFAVWDVLTMPTGNTQYIQAGGYPPMVIVSTRKILSVVKS